MVIGAVEDAVNCTLRTWVGSSVAQQLKLGPVHTWDVPNASVVNVLSRASAKYAWLRPPLFVTVIGTTSGAALAESFLPFGTPVAFTCAVSRPICAVKGSDVW